MKCLIVEDDFVSRKLLQTYLKEYMDCFIAINGSEAIKAFESALENEEPYDFVCLDIMMLEMDGHKVLKKIREIESTYNIVGSDGVKVIMTTALADSVNVKEAFRNGCEAYLVKPIRKDKLLLEIERLCIFNVS